MVVYVLNLEKRSILYSSWIYKISEQLRAWDVRFGAEIIIQVYFVPKKS